MQRKSIYATAAFAVVVVLVGAAAWRAGAPVPLAAVSGAGDIQVHSLSGEAVASAENADEAGMSDSGRRAGNIEALLGELAVLQQSPGNLQAFLESLKKHCRDDADCAALLAEVLSRHPDRHFAALVERTIARMPAYEREMQSMVMSTSTPPRERYEAIQALRDRALGAEEAALAFGQERAWAEYQFAYGELQQKAASMSQEERIGALNDLRARALGAHAKALAAVEGSFGAYERELDISLVGVNDAAARAAITRKLREKHFDEATRAQLETRDSVLAEQKQKVGDYKAEEARLRQQLAAQRGTMSEAAWNALYEQRMAELRLRHFP